MPGLPGSFAATVLHMQKRTGHHLLILAPNRTGETRQMAPLVASEDSRMLFLNPVSLSSVVTEACLCDVYPRLPLPKGHEGVQ